MRSENEDNGTRNELAFLTRPVASLHGLPLAYRWEFTRRHPYYLQFWRLAQVHYAGAVVNEELKLNAGLAAFILSNLGVSASPPPPTATADALGIGQLGRAWADGAVSTITFRAMIGMMLKHLPQAPKLLAASLLAESAGRADDDHAGQFDILARTMSAPEPAFDAAPPRAMIGVNPAAPARAILAAVDALVAGWKRDLGLGETRRRPDVLDDYLAVWDLREGWTGEGYAVDRELPFKQVALERRAAVPTVVSQYEAAFHLLAGHAYDVRHWVTLFGVLKMATRFGPRALARRRVLGGPGRRGARGPKVVTETTLTGDREVRGGGALAVLGVTAECAEWRDAAIDMRDLIERGLGDDEVAGRLASSYPGVSAEVVREVRDRALAGSSPRRPTRRPAK